MLIARLRRVAMTAGHVSHPVQAVLDVPVAAQYVGDLVGPDLGLVKVGDRIDGLAAPAPPGQRPAPAGDLKREPGVREPDAGRHLGHLHGAGLGPAVALVPGVIDGRNLPPRQGSELAVPGWAGCP